MVVSRVLRIIAAVAFFGWVLGHPAPADASCVGPQLTVDRPSVAPGDVLEISGSYFGTDCNDTGGPGPVLGKPQTVISLRIVQGELSVPLVQVDADHDYKFVVRAVVPASLTKGTASVTASSVQLPNLRPSAILIAITESAVASPASVPPTVLVGRDSSLPRIEPPEESSNTRWIVAGVVVAGVVAAIGWVILYRWQQRRPYQWIHDPK
jgi:hypothetical protein